MHDPSTILKSILAGYALPIDGAHGVVHWARVLENGLRIAEAMGADTEIVTLFALFHDSRRKMNTTMMAMDSAAAISRLLRGELVHLDDARFELLYEACCLLTDGLISGDRTLLACWDADRLDLGRVGITPKPERLCTDAARHLLRWANDRAVNGYVPKDVLAAWGCAFA